MRSIISIKQYCRTYMHHMLAGFLIIQILFSFFAASIPVARAQFIPDVINTNSTPSTVNVPQYTGRGVDESIKAYLCVPDESNLGTGLFTCITKLYRFGIAFGAIALVFFIVYAGYVYITGGEAAKAKGKGVVLSALTGMALILSSFVLLNFINPELVKIKPIQPPIFSASGLPACEDVGLGVNCVLPNGQVTTSGTGGGAYGDGKKCTPIKTGPLSIEGLKNSCFARLGGDEVLRQASIVANMETGGAMIPVNAGSCGRGQKPARCTGGEIPVWGVYQINIAANNLILENGQTLNCPAAFGNNGFGCQRGCSVTNQSLYKECSTKAMNMTVQLNSACNIYVRSKKAGNHGFQPWGNSGNLHYQKCNFPNVALPPGV